MATPVILCSLSHDDVLGAHILKKYVIKDAQVVIGFFGKPFPVTIEPGSDVWLVDLSYPRNELINISKRYNLKVLSHDPTFIDTCMSVDPSLIAIEDESMCGCELAWAYHVKVNNIIDKVPRIVQLIADYDKWQFKLEDTLACHYGLSLFQTYPEAKNDIWDKLIDSFDPLLDDLISRGKAIHEFVVENNKYLCRQLAYPVEHGGYKLLCANVRGADSKLFDTYKGKEDFDAFLLYGWIASIGKVRYSVYSNKPEVDASKIAELFKGSGRHEVGGFMTEGAFVKDFPMETPKEDGSEQLELYANLTRSAALRTYNSKINKVGIKAQMFIGSFGNRKTAFCNTYHEYPDVWFDLNPMVDLGICFVRTAKNGIRLTITNLSGSVDMKELASKLKGDLNDYGCVVAYVPSLGMCTSLFETVKNI